jgi:hypothetical protein
MGSHLSVGKNRVWFQPDALVLGGIAKLARGAEGVRANSLVSKVYGALINFLSNTHDVIPFPYDWHLSMEIAAQRFADALSPIIEKAERHNFPVSILAHSTGGLVVQAMISLRPEVWERLCRHPQTRFIMLGMPNKGFYFTPRLLLGREPLIHLLGLLDLKLSAKDISQVFSQFPGLLEMLPTTVGFQTEQDFFDSYTWKELCKISGSTGIPPKQNDLEMARRFQERLDDFHFEPNRMIYVAGRATATIVGHTIEKDKNGTKCLRFLATPEGDGRVPWSQGIPDGIPSWVMDTEHGNMASHKPSFPAILDLLQTGRTSRLVKTRNFPPKHFRILVHSSLRRWGLSLSHRNQAW